MAPRETENNAYAEFCGDKQRALWYVMVFSGVVNRNFARKIHMKIEFSSQRRDMLLFWNNNMAVVTSRANEQ